MQARISVMVIAKPGHFRNSLVALLKTLPYADLTLAEGSPQSVLEMTRQVMPDIVLVDSDTLGDAIADFLATLEENLPGGKRVVLVDNIRQLGRTKSYGVDCVLMKSVSAGEFLSTLKGLSVDHKQVIPRLAYSTL